MYVYMYMYMYVFDITAVVYCYVIYIHVQFYITIYILTHVQLYGCDTTSIHNVILNSNTFITLHPCIYCLINVHVLKFFF